MLELTNLRLSDVGVFHGRQEVEFASSTAGGLTLVIGGNGTGKTTIASAIHFALALDHFGPLSSHKGSIGRVGRVGVSVETQSKEREWLLTPLDDMPTGPPEAMECYRLPDRRDDHMMCAIGPSHYEDIDWEAIGAEATRLYRDVAGRSGGRKEELDITVSGEGSPSVRAAGKKDITKDLATGDSLFVGLCAFLARLNATPTGYFVISDGFFGWLGRESGELALELILDNGGVRQFLLLAHDAYLPRGAIERTHPASRYELRFSDDLGASSIVAA
jgi:hypothetical protein